MIGQNILHYKILAKLGEGGMGEVYLAEDTKLERKVALKFLPQHLSTDPKLQARFQREARAAAALNHPNIITVYEIGEQEGRAYIAMEYVDGQSLRELMVQSELPEDRIIDILSQVCEGLSQAHQAGIVHRDLKPENLMLDADGKVRILDFGLAKLKGKSKLSFTKSTMGTVSYMAPELCEGAEIDHRADIWTVGVMLYEMVTGKLPFDGEHEAAIIYAIVNEEPTPLVHHKTGVSVDLQRIVDKAVDKDRETRYQHIPEVLADLDRVKNSEAVSAKPMNRLRKKKMARSLMRYTVFTAFFVLLAVTAFYFWGNKPIKRIPVKHQQVTFVGDASWPAISPDGQLLAYVRGKTSEQKLMVEDFVSSQTFDVSAGINFIGSLNWTPNGAELSFYGGNDPSSLGAYIVPRLGGTARRISVLFYSSWSPNGAYISHTNANWKVIRITNTTTNFGGLGIWVNGPYQWLDGIEWSPLFNRLLFNTIGDERYTIWTIKIDWTEMQKVVENSNILFSPRWAANGNAIYYFQAIGRTKQLMKIKISTKTGKAKSEPEVLQDGMETGEVFTIARDNKRLFYTRELRYSNLWYVDLGDENTAPAFQPKQLTTGTLTNFSPSISPNSQKIAFSVAKGTQANIFVMPIAGRQMQQITYMNAYNTTPVWSPDGQEIAFASWQDESKKVWRVKANGGQPQPFSITKISSDLKLTWFPGRDILYQKPGGRNFQKLNTITEEEAPLVLNESVGWILFQPCYSPDGKRVAIFRHDQFGNSKSGLWLISLQDSSQRLLFEAEPVNAVSPLVWSEDSQWIYVLSAAKTPQEILKISTEDGKARPVFTLPVDEIDGVSITPDGKQLVYAAVEKKSDVWFMEHFDPENELDSPIELSDTTEFRQLAYLEEATILLQSKKYVEAENLSRKGLQINPRHVGLLEVLGRSLYDQKKYVEAEREFRNALDLVPDQIFILQRSHKAAFYSKNYKDARRYIKVYLDIVTRLIQPNQQAYAYVRLGVIDMIAKDYTNAEHNFRSALAIDSTNSQALMEFGYLFGMRNRYAEAEKYAFQAFRMDSSFVNYNLTAWVLVSGEIDIDRGIAFAERALASKPEDWHESAEIYPYYAIPEHTLGLAYLKKGVYKKAVQYLEQAAAFAPQQQAIQDDLLRAKQRLKEMANQ